MSPSLYYHQLPQGYKLCAGRKIEELESDIRFEITAELKIANQQVFIEIIIKQ